MHIAIRTIKKPSSCICASEIIFKEQKCLAISIGKFLEIYDVTKCKFDKVHKIFVGACIVAIIPMRYNNYMLVSKDNQFVIMKDDQLIKRSNINEDKKSRIINKLKKYVFNEDYIVFLFDNNKLAVIYLINDNIRIKEQIKDLIAYTVLDISLNRSELICLVSDTEMKTYIHRYNLKENAKDFVFKERKAFNTAFRIGQARDFLLIFRKNQISILGNEQQCEIQSANPTFLNGISWKDGYLAIMGDQELVFITKEKIKIIKKFNNVINEIMYVNGLLFGRSFHGNSVLFSITEDVTIFDQLENISFLRDLQFQKGLHFLSGKDQNNFECTLKYRIPVKNSIYYNFNKIIKKFWIYNNLIFISYVNNSVIIKNNKVLETTDEILNFKVFGNSCLFHTYNKIIKHTDHVIKSKIPGILLSDINENEIFIYTKKKELILFDCNSMKIIQMKEIKNEVSAVKKINDNFAISTFNDEFILFDRKFMIIEKIEIPTIGHCEQLNENILIFNTLLGSIGILDLKVFKTKSLLESHYMNGIIKFKNGVIFYGEETIFIDENLFCVSVDLRKINSAFKSGRHYYVCMEKRILKVKLATNAEFRIKKNKIKGFGLTLSRTSKEQILGYQNGSSSIIINNLVKEQIEIKNEIIQKANFNKKYLIVATNFVDSNGIDSSKLILFEKMTKIDEISKKGLLFSLDTFDNLIATSHGVYLTVYKIENGKFVELSQIASPVLPWKIRFSNLNLIVCDIWRTFAVHYFDPETNTIIEKKRCHEDIIVDDAFMLHSQFLVADSNGCLFFCDEGCTEREIIWKAAFNYNEPILCVKKGTLNKKKEKNIFYASSKFGSIAVIQIFDKNLIIQQIKHLIRKLSNSTIFNYEEAISYSNVEGKNNTDIFIDCDILKYHPLLNNYLEKYFPGNMEIKSKIHELCSIH